jgi:hypothetical protein
LKEPAAYGREFSSHTLAVLTMHKSTRTLLLAASALLAVSSASAQTVDLVTVEKLTEYYQSSAGAPTLAGSLPYRFDFALMNLAGGNISGITPPTVTLPAGSQAPANLPVAHNGGVLVYNDGEWRYGSDGAGGGGYGVGLAVVPNLNNLFVNGVYGVTVQGNSYSLDLDGPANTDAFFPGFIPTLTMSGGSWSGGKYVIDVTQALTITTNSFAALHTTGVGAFINIDVEDVGQELLFSRIAPTSFASEIESNTGITTATFTIAANTLTSGQDYFGSASFHRIVSQDTSQPGIFAVAWWGNETGFTISAIPEPSTYAALAGIGALGLAIWRRRLVAPKSGQA